MILGQEPIIILASLATSLRVIGLILLSIVTGWFLSYAAIRNRLFENTFVSLIEVFESVPVISFFPIVLIIFVQNIGGYLGVELAADFLIFTAVVWNIWMGEYQAFKTVPREMVEVTENYRFGFFSKLRNVYIPFSIPRIAANLFPSVADGFFYITVSEVFSIGNNTFSTFGIGSLLASYLNQSQWDYVDESLITMAIIIVLIVLGIREISNQAVAKYTIDTDTRIVRRGRLNVRQSSRLSAVISRNALGRLSYYYKRSVKVNREIDEEREGFHLPKLTSKVIVAGIMIGFLYLIANTILSVSPSIWGILVPQTPLLLLYLGYDYVRVGVIVIISLVLSVTLGYYLAVNPRVERVVIPVIQVVSAYPAPIYFPLIFGATLPFVHTFLGPLTSEFYVISLGFISTFYYVFYSFWMGVRAMPSEFWEIIKNYDLGFFEKMKKVILPSTLPYLISGISSTINSAWGGLMIAEYWPSITPQASLEVKHGLMKLIDVSTASGNIAEAAYASLIFGLVVVIYSILFTRKMMDLARKKYVAEEAIYSA